MLLNTHLLTPNSLKTMHNIISQNRMADWNHHSYDTYVSSSEQALDDYYECLIECDDSQSSCKRICKEILS